MDEPPPYPTAMTEKPGAPPLDSARSAPVYNQPQYGQPVGPTQYSTPQYGQPVGPAPYPAPQPAPVQSMQPTPAVAVVSVNMPRRLGRYPIRTTCTHCQSEVVTVVRYDAGLISWIGVGGCVVIGCCLGCCLIPLFVDSCKDAIHTCPNCSAVLGRTSPL